MFFCLGITIHVFESSFLNKRVSKDQYRRQPYELGISNEVRIYIENRIVVLNLQETINIH